MSISQNFPATWPSLSLDFANSKILDPRITFTRASTGTYVGADGLVKTAVANQARFDHDPATGESLGLLIEEQRTNLHLYSQEINLWTAESGGSVVANNQISPDGTQNADTLTGTQYGSGVYVVTNLNNATTYTSSVFLKYISGNSLIEIQIGDAPFARSITRVDTQNGTLSYNSGGAIVSYSIEPYANGWYRYSITRTTTASGGGFMGINHVSSTTSEVAIWGAQVEEGGFTTSYIPTGTSAVTRSGDSASVSGTNFLNFYNHLEGTYIIDYKRGYAGTNTPSYNSPGLLYSYSLLVFSVIQEGEYVKNQNVNDQALVGSATTSTFRKLAVVYNSSSYGGCISGGNVVIRGGGFNSSQDSYIAFGIIQGATLHRIKSLTYYPERLSDSQIQNLTK